MTAPDAPERACPLCGPGAAASLFASANIDSARVGAYTFASRKTPELMRHRLMLCAGCDVVYANPAPTADELAAAYRSAEYDSGTEARYAAATYAAQLSDLLPRLPCRTGALDIGAGDGAFLSELLDRGFTEVSGVEPSAAPIASAEQRVRPLLRNDVFRAEQFQPDSLSLVTCFQTIEHVPDPLQMCREALALLRPGGALVMVCHNRRSPVNRALGLKSPIIDIEHLQLFSPRSAEALLERAGFRDVCSKAISNRYPARYWVRLLPLPASVKSSLISLLDRTRAGLLPVRLRVGNMLVLGLKPTD